jgi:hypothetical protein
VKRKCGEATINDPRGSYFLRAVELAGAADSEDAITYAKALDEIVDLLRAKDENSNLLNDVSVWRNRAIAAEGELAGTNRITSSNRKEGMS